MLSDPNHHSLIALSLSIGYTSLGIALLGALFRMIVGPTNLDRVIALDLIAGLCLATTALLAIDTGKSVYLNVALCLAVIAFLATVAFAKRFERSPDELWKS